MRLFIGALVLKFMLFINEIETASDNWYYPTSLGHSSQGYTPTIMTQNGQIQQQWTSGQLERRPTTQDPRVIAANLAEAQGVHQPQIQEGFYDHRIAHFKDKFNYKAAVQAVNQHYPHGFPDPKPLSGVSSEKPPPALHEKDKMFTAGGYTRKYYDNRRKNKAAKLKAVSDSNDQSSQHSQSPKHPYSDSESQLIYNHNIINPYFENLGRNSDLHPQSHNGGSASG